MPVIDIPIVGGTYKHKSLPFDAQTCINLYPEIGGRQSTSGSILRRRPVLLYDEGKSRDESLYAGPLPSIITNNFNDIGTMRGVYASHTGGLYAAVSNRILLFTQNKSVPVSGTPYLIGDCFSFNPSLMNTTTAHRVVFSEDSTNIIWCDGTNIYYSAKLSGTSIPVPTVTEVTDAQAPDTTPMIEVIGGYTFGFTPITNAGVFGHSNLHDVTTWDAADQYTAEGAQDPLVALKGLKGNVWLLGTNTFEVWGNTGRATRTWALIQGTISNIGCNAKWSAQVGFGRIFWLGGSKEGNNIIFVNEGFQARRISNHALEETINSFSAVDDATAIIYQESGHQFYEITFPTGDKTFVYDITAGEWHERAYRNPTSGEFERNLPVYHAYFQNKNWVTSRNDSSIYEYSSTKFTDDVTESQGSAGVPGNPGVNTYAATSNPITWERTLPNIGNKRKRIKWHRFEVPIQTGVGLTSGQGSDPMIAISWSDDGGRTYGNWHSMSIGKMGEYGYRAIIRRLGSSHSQGRTFRIRGSDPVETFIQDNAVAEVTFAN